MMVSRILLIALLPITFATNAFADSDCDNTCTKANNNDSYAINNLDDAIKVLENKRTIMHEKKKKRIDNDKEYYKYLSTEKRANIAWLKYIDNECYSRVLGYAHAESPAFDSLREECMLEKYKTRINDSFLEHK